MREPTLGEKISWFLHRSGLSAATKPAYLHTAKFADPEWFKVADALIQAKNLEGRDLILDYLLVARNFSRHPKRAQIIRLVGYFLNKGILDERRRVVQYIDDNPSLFHEKDDALFGPLMTAQRDSDISIATTAESAIKKLKGENPDPLL